MNIVPTFEYDLYKPVFFLLYYDGEKDIDTSNNKLKFKICILIIVYKVVITQFLRL